MHANLTPCQRTNVWLFTRGLTTWVHTQNHIVKRDKLLICTPCFACGKYSILTTEPCVCPFLPHSRSCGWKTGQAIESRTCTNQIFITLIEWLTQQVDCCITIKRNSRSASFSWLFQPTISVSTITPCTLRGTHGSLTSVRTDTTWVKGKIGLFMFTTTDTQTNLSSA